MAESGSFAGSGLTRKQSETFDTIASELKEVNKSLLRMLGVTVDKKTGDVTSDRKSVV